MDSLRGVSCDCSSFWRLTLRIMPSAMVVKMVDEPPRDQRQRSSRFGDQVDGHHDMQQRLAGYQQGEPQYQ